VGSALQMDDEMGFVALETDAEDELSSGDEEERPPTLSLGSAPSTDDETDLTGGDDDEDEGGAQGDKGEDPVVSFEPTEEEEVGCGHLWA